MGITICRSFEIEAYPIGKLISHDQILMSLKAESIREQLNMTNFDVNNPSVFPKNRCFICGKKLGLKDAFSSTQTRDKKKICFEDSVKIFGRKSVKHSLGRDYLAYKYANKITNSTSRELYILAYKSDLAKESEAKGVLCCPLCGSTDLQVTGGNNKKDFSLGKAVGGALLVGGVGALAGFLGEGSDKADILCMNCGLKFKK